MLPAIALLAGAAVSTAVKLWPRASWLAYGLFSAALMISVVQQQRYLFQMSPIEIVRTMYGQSPFPEAIPIADYIRTHTEKNSRIAILGSEPEIPFYAHRLSATGYIYMYGLMEPQPYALTMQDEFIHDVETAQPDYIVFVTYPTSWMQQEGISTFKILDWWAAYQPQKYKQIVGVADIIANNHTEYHWSDASSYQLQSSSAVVIYKRTDPADDATALLNQADALEAQKSLELTAQENRQMFAFILDPRNYGALNNLGMLMARQGLTKEALKEFRLSLTVKPDQAEAHADTGWTLTQTHQFPEAAEEFAQALRFSPDAADSHNNLGAVLLQLGDYERAAEQFKEAINIDPSYTDAKENLNLAQTELNRHQKQ
jgi:tetratricopeptide (TPR) repeat protein